MVNPEIEEYLLAGLRRGLGLEEVRQQLLARGDSDLDINEAIQKITPEEKEKQPVKEEPKPEDIDNWADNLE